MNKIRLSVAVLLATAGIANAEVAYGVTAQGRHQQAELRIEQAHALARPRKFPLTFTCEPE